MEYLISAIVKLFTSSTFIHSFAVQTPLKAAKGDYFSEAFTAIGAAFATLGYYAQADLIEAITGTKYGGSVASMLYIFGYMGVIIALAFGQSPKNWVWLAIGPGIFWFLIGTTQEATGVIWKVNIMRKNNMTPDQYNQLYNPKLEEHMRQVWKLAEVGLLNSEYLARRDAQVFSDAPPSKKAVVSTVFLHFDGVMSELVSNMMNWSGLFITRKNINTAASNTCLTPPSNGAKDDWFILSNLKWGWLDNITYARLSSPDLRDAFVTFMASECGDAVQSQISRAKFIAASNSRGLAVPCGILDTGTDTTYTTTNDPDNKFQQQKSNDLCKYADNADYSTFRQTLENTFYPLDPSSSIVVFVRDNVKKDCGSGGGNTNNTDPGSFGDAIDSICSSDTQFKSAIDGLKNDN
ncbi:MAG: hypothetical protein D6780_06055, partial [Candidatus Dadabacteria bacterium]